MDFPEFEFIPIPARSSKVISREMRKVESSNTERKYNSQLATAAVIELVSYWIGLSL